MSGSTLAACWIAVSATILVAAALHDIAFRTVPNWMCLIVASAAVMLRAMQGNLAASACVALAVFVVAGCCWWRGWMGGADVKLLAASTMLVPPVLAMALVLHIALAGGVLAMLYIGFAKLASRPCAVRPTGLLRRIWRAERYRMHRRGPLPYASAIAAGAMLMLVKG